MDEYFYIKSKTREHKEMQRNVNEEQCLPLWGRELEAIEKEYAKRLTSLAVFYVLGARYRSIGCTFIPFCMLNIVECIFYSTYLPEALVKKNSQVCFRPSRSESPEVGLENLPPR